jgi:hypothetical protein
MRFYVRRRVGDLAIFPNFRPVSFRETGLSLRRRPGRFRRRGGEQNGENSKPGAAKQKMKRNFGVIILRSDASELAGEVKSYL